MRAASTAWTGWHPDGGQRLRQTIGTGAPTNYARLDQRAHALLQEEADYPRYA
jgi:hypothetical protein